jgi:NAD(P)-dependent dehydrogenase (short-subunit alcohol dehydrogenase family)
MLLEGKNAVIYGGGGSIGGAVARAFGREGARVFLAGRTQAKLDAVAEDIRSEGGKAETAEVDALDEKAVDEHADGVAAAAGSLDVSFNLITHPAVHGTPLAEMEVDDFMSSVVTALRSSFITSRAPHGEAEVGRDPDLSAARVTRCATTTSAGRRSPSRRSRSCGSSSPWSSASRGSAR